MSEVCELGSGDAERTGARREVEASELVVAGAKAWDRRRQLQRPDRVSGIEVPDGEAAPEGDGENGRNEALRGRSAVRCDDDERGPHLEHEPGEVEGHGRVPERRERAEARNAPGVKGGVAERPLRHEEGEDPGIAARRNGFKHTE